jgi:hypothetical protein
MNCLCSDVKTREELDLKALTAAISTVFDNKTSECVFVCQCMCFDNLFYMYGVIRCYRVCDFCFFYSFLWDN